MLNNRKSAYFSPPCNESEKRNDVPEIKSIKLYIMDTKMTSAEFRKNGDKARTDLSNTPTIFSLFTNQLHPHPQ